MKYICPRTKGCSSVGGWKHIEDGVIVASDGYQIASVFPRNRVANAPLIAAAPDMYEALKEIVGLAPRDKLKLPYAIQVVEIADKALAKVEVKP